VEDGAGVPGEAMLLVTAEMRRRPAAGFGSTSDRATPGATSEAMPLEDAYAHFRAKGLEHTGAMKAEGTIRVTDTGRWIEVTLPPEARADAAAYLLHPTLLDGAAVGAGPLFDAMLGGEDRLFLPLFFGRFRAREALRERCEARVRTATLRRKNELLYSDLEFFNAAGEQVAELTDFVYKLVRRSDAVQLAAPGAGAESRKETAATACAGEERIAVSAGDAPGDVAARLVQSVIGAKLKRPAEAVELDAGYYELGLDSAMLLDVVAVLGRKLAAALSPTLLFEFATPRELAAQLAATHPAEIARLAMAPAAEEVPAARFVVAAFPLRAASAPQRDRKAAEVLVAGLLERRMALWVEDGAVKARAEEARLTPEVRAEIAANAAAIAEIAGARRLLPMTRSQRRYWVLSTLQPERSAYNNPIGMRLRGEVDVTRLKEAVTILVNSHHVLRAEFPRLGRGPVMALAPAVKEFPCQLIRLPATDAAARERALQELAARESAEPINPGVGPNLRVTLVALAADDVAVLLTAHHAVFDGYSYLPVMSELMRIYRALERGQRPDTDGIVQYEDYALREPAPGSEAAARFWREHLAGAPGGTVLPFDRERAPVNAGRGDVRSIRIGEAAYRSIHATLQERQVSLFAFMLSILKAAIAGWAQQGDLVFGTTVQCRDEDNDKDVIGDFTNFIPIRSRIDAEEPFAALLQRVHRTSLLCLQHKAFPFDAIVALAGPAPRSGNPVYNILVNQLPSITAMEERISDDRRRVTVSNNRLLNRSAMLDLRFEWYEEEGGLRLIGEYNTDLFRDETIERLLQRIEACLNERVYAGAVKVADLMPRRTPAPAVQEKAASAPATVAETRAAGANEVEALIVEKIRGLKEVPGIERMKEVNFFELGLGSFDIANLSVELEPRHPELVVGDFFKYPTIRALAAHLAAIGSNAESQTSGSEIADVGRHGGRPSDEAEAVRDGDGAIDFELLFRT
ncbi:MAG TPA: condensation domain-containing protein, partial [Opitutus sp.]|nr:condensation domain-containing protein [Opitutus sp.]